MFERPAEGPSQEEQLRQRLTELERQRTEIEFYLEHRERDSYLVGKSDADRLADVNEQIAAVKKELGEPAESEVSMEKNEDSREKAA